LKAEGITWEKWSDEAFARAKKEKRLVILDLEAVWCHWCHVMNEVTYADHKVAALIRDHYVALRVDQDSRPDLSNRYEDYGWPATIIFDADGKEIVKRSAYIPPKPMAKLLQACVDDPTPGPSVQPEPELAFAKDAALPDALRKELRTLHLERYDRDQKGWGSSHKYLDPDSVEFSLVQAARGDAGAEKMARETLAAQLALVDPVWGGVYQYSTGGRWDEPHFEKIMSFQADDLRVYALAYEQFGDEAYVKAARAIRRYLKDFLTSPEGAFYVSQDADLVPGEHSGGYFKLDDAGRRKLGVPRVDTHVYARENGWAIQGLTAFYAATGETAALEEAVRAAEWIAAHRALPDGGFRHDEKDAAGPYLGDTLAMGRAFLSLYGITGERRWLTRAEDAAAFIAKNFKSTAGFATAQAQPGEPAGLAPHPQRDENVALARFANLLHQYTGKPEHRALAAHAFRYLTAPEVARRFPTASALLAEEELALPPVHITVVGTKADAKAVELFKAAIRFPGAYKRVDWYDPKEGKLPDSDVDYPELPKPAAFVCGKGRCSLPVIKPAELRDAVERVTKRKPE
ncbi:MAG: thioredoxin domain-containing protein, partial [Planctomycetes bacterium]|nr:thioredoxin domain-containing protein [Planctomycetota bacterium]